MTFCSTLKRLSILTAVVLLLGWTGAEEAHAQRFQIKWMNVGSFHNYYSEGGIEPRRNPRQGLQWPAYDPHTDHFVRKALWIAVTNWTDPEGETWNHKISHVGPRSQGEDEVFPLEFELRAKFDEPAVTVDGLQSFSKPVFSSSIDQIDPSLKADRLIYNKFNTLHGITVERRVRAFSQEHHDNYHVIEYVLTNTGNVDGDEEVELPDQTLEGLVLGLRHKYSITLGARGWIDGGVAWGKNQVTDAVGDGMEDYDTDFRAMYTWHGRIPGFTRYNNLGAPIWDDGNWQVPEGDSLGRLGAHSFVGRVFMHADKSAADDSDDPSQPTTTKTFDSGEFQGDSNNAWNVPGMAAQYDFMTSGHEYPHHADQVTSPELFNNWREQMANAEQAASKGINAGIVPFEAYGPYTLAPGESVRIVYAEGISGLSRQAAIDVGKAYKRSNGDDNLLIEFDANGDGQITDIPDGAANVEGDERMTKNAWAMTSRDSVFKMFRRAEANLESGFDIPEPPKPPKSFTVTSGADQITLDWTTFDGVNPPGGFEIYRTRNLYRGAVEDDYQYQLVAEVSPDTRHYEDTEVTRGINYFYYIQAVGEDRPADPQTMTPGGPLKSSRYYTQTYNPATLKRQPGSALEDARIVPNPVNISASKEVRWPEEDRVAFLEIPGQCTIRIYTERGDLVQTIEHTDGSGDEFWNLQTLSNQLIVSGLYHAVIEDTETGEQVIRSFAVVR